MAYSSGSAGQGGARAGPTLVKLPLTKIAHGPLGLTLRIVML